MVSLEAISEARQLYAYAVPNEAAVRRIANLGPVVEVGAGLGYWARLLADAGCDVVATDVCGADPLESWDQVTAGDLGFDPCFFHPDAALYYPVQRMDAEAAARTYSDRALLLVWPPYETPMASDALRAFEGATVVVVGEGRGGATGDDRFFDLLEEEFELVDVVGIPQWAGMNDDVHIYRRRSDT